jgi:hypothetical protein
MASLAWQLSAPYLGSRAVLGLLVGQTSDRPTVSVGAAEGHDASGLSRVPRLGFVPWIPGPGPDAGRP